MVVYFNQMRGFFTISFKELREVLYQAGKRLSYQSMTLTASGRETRHYPLVGQETHPYPVWMDQETRCYPTWVALLSPAQRVI